MSERLKIIIGDRVQDSIEDHAFSKVDVEVGGFLLGKADGSSVRILDARPALQAESTQTKLTFTHETWADVLEYLENDQSGNEIVGWYHTHPNFGCFLSDYDEFIQENFFSGPGQVALVLDPVRGELAFFRVEAGQTKTLLETATRHRALGNQSREPLGLESLSGAGMEGRRRRVVPLVASGLVVALLAGVIGWFVGSVTGQDAAREEARSQLTDLRDEVASLQEQRDAINTLETEDTSNGAQLEVQPVEESEVVPEVPQEPVEEFEVAPEALPEPTVQPGDEVLVLATHTFRRGETVWGLAASYLGSGERYREILAVNPGLNPRRIQIGDPIRIPLVAEFQSAGQGTP